ncbi:hypothetical protein [Alloactinosynnema sp. L-07]|uniref:hypothetical protein n=1 Tax=Alloactinosynnema sp. L-07 TaxID=1653480 RepID=UPI00065EFE0D|nr:hypothetical protein [Alloactinosynnema sp. L-07]CRK60059.1 hypothetical protein [Alloactinosynnema sp. L-07]
MGDQVTVDPGELDGCAELLRHNAQHFLTIKEHATSKGGDTSGFTGLLSLLIPVVDGVVSLYGETLDFANSMMLKEADALSEAAASYAKADRLWSDIFQQITDQIDTLSAPTVGGGAR